MSLCEQGGDRVLDKLEQMPEIDRSDVSPEYTFETQLRAAVSRCSDNCSRLLSLQQLSAGASQELWSFDAEIRGSLYPMILRRNPGGHEVRALAAGMDVEVRVMQLAKAAKVPVPKIIGALLPEDGLGSGFLMERIEGETIPRRILRRPDLAHARTGLARESGEVLARIHSIETASLHDLDSYGPSGAVVATRALYQSTGCARPVMELAFRWLKDHLPPDPAQFAVVHGDMRNGNIIVDQHGLRAVLDWELVHLGDPMEDLGWMCVPSWRFGQIDKPVGGFGSREALFAGHEAVTGQSVDLDRVRFWEVLGTLRWGIGCLNMAREFADGDRSIERAVIGRRASESEIDLLSMLWPRGTAI